MFLPFLDHRPHGRPEMPVPLLPRSDSTAEFQPLEDKEVEYFFASDASAVIEHTNRVIFLEVCRLCIYFKVVFDERNFCAYCNLRAKLLKNEGK